MIAVIPFEPGHLALLDLQAEQLLEAAADDAGTAATLAASGPCFTARYGDRVILCAGLIESHRGYATAWARLAAGKGAALVGLTRATRRVLDAASYRRIDTLVRATFDEAHLWAAMLGFKREGRLRAYAADGSDFDLYARIRETI